MLLTARLVDYIAETRPMTHESEPASCVATSAAGNDENAENAARRTDGRIGSTEECTFLVLSLII